MNVTLAPSFVPNPSGRGTLGLLWECLFTYFLCLWTVVHTNTNPTDSRLAKSNSKIIWCCLIFLLPEWGISIVMGEYIDARATRNHANNVIQGNKDIEAIPLASLSPGDDTGHEAHKLVESIAPAISSKENGHVSSCPVSRKFVGQGSRWKLVHGYLVGMGVLQFKLNDATTQVPTLEQIEKFAKCGMLPTADFLNKKVVALQKSDRLAKGVVCLQVLWLVIQAVARKAEQLPVTLLELNTIAQVWITLFIYGLWWFKPQGIVEVIEIDFSYCKKCQERLCKTVEITGQPTTSSVVESFALVAVLVVSAVFITIDALGWTAYFPTHAEMIIWRLSICLLVAGVLLIFVSFGFRDREDVSKTIFVFSFFLAVVARILLTIEALISIRSLPVGAYKTPSWSDFLPHIG